MSSAKPRDPSPAARHRALELHQMPKASIGSRCAASWDAVAGSQVMASPPVPLTVAHKLTLGHEIVHSIWGPASPVAWLAHTVAAVGVAVSRTLPVKSAAAHSVTVGHDTLMSGA